MHHPWVAVCMPVLLSLKRRYGHRTVVEETGGKQGRVSRRPPSLLSIGPGEARNQRH